MSAGLLATACSGVIDDAFVYFPARQWAMTPADAGLRYEDRWIYAADGVRLHAWYIPHPRPRATVLHFHGNAGNVSHRVPLYARLAELGLTVLAVDYRGYGRSAGHPDEPGLYEDGRAAWGELTGGLGASAEQIVIAGRSLGSAVAVAVAAEHRCRGVVLETPFTSLPDLARVHYPFLPVGWLLRGRYDSLSRAPRLRAPTLVIEAANDEIIPRRLVDKLHAALPAPAGRVRLAGGHNDFDQVSSRGHANAWSGFLDALDARWDGAG